MSVLGLTWLLLCKTRCFGSAKFYEYFAEFTNFQSENL